MSQPRYSLAWESFKTNICTGFSNFQQNGEFVDMTLAADGHFVKVHQVIIALASPYLKKLMASAPCPHPIIFLNNVSHKVLCYLLEYVYTGEVVVPSEYLSSFTNAAKLLHIKGLENISNQSNEDNQNKLHGAAQPTDIEIGRCSSLKRKNVDKDQLPPSARKVLVKIEGSNLSEKHSLVDTGNDSQEYDLFDVHSGHDSDDAVKPVGQSIRNDFSKDPLKTNQSTLQYTISIRDSLQAILNRYIYNLTWTATRTGVRRWRCIEYRKNKCNAFIETKGSLAVNRAHFHNHPYHDKKILAKIEKKAVFSAIDDVEAYREKEKSTEEKGRNENMDEVEDDRFEKEKS